MHAQRISISRSTPDILQTVVKLERQVNEYALSAGFSEGFTHLLRLRASQLNQCAYCLRMHTRDALASGETAERICILPAWRETEYFTDKERAALELIEAVTLIADGQVPDSVYEQAVNLLTQEEILAVEWLGIAINIWNRIAIPSRTVVKP